MNGKYSKNDFDILGQRKGVGIVLPQTPMPKICQNQGRGANSPLFPFLYMYIHYIPLFRFYILYYYPFRAR